MAGIKVYTEPASKSPSAERRYWVQSNEAEAAGHPYIVIRRKKAFAKICCDWITTPPATRVNRLRPADRFTRMAASHLEQCWPSVKVDCLGSYTLLSRVPISQSEAVAEDIAALAFIALQQAEREHQP